MVMKEVNLTTFFTNTFMNITTKSLLYMGCATFILTGSQVINRFIGSNVSAASGREQLMSLMGYGKMAGIGATATAGAIVGGSLLATGGVMKVGKSAGTSAMEKIGIALGTMGPMNSSGGEEPTKMQKMANAMGTKMYTKSQMMRNGNSKSKFNSASDALMNAGASSINNSVRKVMPRASYNTSYYKRRNNII